MKGLPVYGFKGIPFALPPVGELRFERPRPHPGWEGTLRADKSPMCVQVGV